MVNREGRYVRLGRWRLRSERLKYKQLQNDTVLDMVSLDPGDFFALKDINEMELYVRFSQAPSSPAYGTW